MVGIGFGNSEEGSGKDRAADAAMGVWTYSGGWKMYILRGSSQLGRAAFLDCFLPLPLRLPLILTCGIPTLEKLLHFGDRSGRGENLV